MALQRLRDRGLCCGEEFPSGHHFHALIASTPPAAAPLSAPEQIPPAVSSTSHPAESPVQDGLIKDSEIDTCPLRRLFPWRVSRLGMFDPPPEAVPFQQRFPMA